MRRSAVGFCVCVLTLSSVGFSALGQWVESSTDPVTGLQSASVLTPQPTLQAVIETVTPPAPTALVSVQSQGITEAELNQRLAGLLYHTRWLLAQQQSAYTTSNIQDANLGAQVNRLERQLFSLMDESEDDRSGLSDSLTENGSFLLPTLTDATLAGTTTAAAIAATGTITTTGRLGVGTTSPADTLAVAGAIYLAETAPVNAVSRLYNLGGDLYWNGSVVTSSTTGNWSASGGNVYRVSGNVGIGTTTPQSSLHIDGDVQIGNSVLSYNLLQDYLDLPEKIRIGGNADGQVWNLGVNGRIIFRTDNLDIRTESGDQVLETDSGGNVGIGTTSPSAKLTIEHTGTSNAFRVNDESRDASPFVITEEGRVGIGTSTPYRDLDVVGSAQVVSRFTRANGGDVLVDVYSTLADSSRGIRFMSGGGDTQFAVGHDGENNVFRIGRGGGSLSDSSSDLTINSSGLVSIGTSTSAERLYVSNGNILLDNTKFLKWRDAGGVVRNIINYNAGNHLTLNTGATDGGDIVFSTRGEEVLRLDQSSGNVGIGTTGPSAKLTVIDTVNYSSVAKCLARVVLM